MVAILKPFQNLLAPGTKQIPQGRIVVDWSQSITRSMIGCWLPGAAGFDNLGLVPVRLSNPTAFGGFAPTQHGQGFRSVSTGGGAFATAPAQFKSWSELTLFWLGMRIGECVGSSAFLAVSYDNAASAPYIVAQLGYEGSALQVYWNSAGSPNFTNPTIPAGNRANFAMLSIGVVFKVGTNNRCFSDGIMVNASSAFGASGPTSTATSTIELNGEIATTTRVANHICNTACIWSRALSDEEMRSMHEAPYSFLIPAEYEMPALFTGPSFISGWSRQSNLPVIGGGTF